VVHVVCGFAWSEEISAVSRATTKDFLAITTAKRHPGKQPAMLVQGYMKSMLPDQQHKPASRLCCLCTFLEPSSETGCEEWLYERCLHWSIIALKTRPGAFKSMP